MKDEFEEIKESRVFAVRPKQMAMKKLGVQCMTIHITAYENIPASLFPQASVNLSFAHFPSV